MSWKDPQKWEALKSGSACSMCVKKDEEQNADSFKVAEFPTSIVRLPRNQYMHGWVVLVLKRHATELYDLSPEELAQFFQDVAQAAKAVTTVFAPVKINYAIYGNLCPHIHCHLFPRYLNHDPNAPLNHNAREVFWNEEEYKKVIVKLQEALSL